MRYSIREVDGLEDEAVLLDLQKLCLPQDTPHVTYVGHWWLLECADAAVGFAGMTVSAQTSFGGYLCRAGVLSDHRGKGLQRRLIRVREAKAKRLGWTQLVTDTAPFNVASSNNLIACGYRLYLPVLPWGLSTSLYWRKRL